MSYNCANTKKAAEAPVEMQPTPSGALRKRTRLARWCRRLLLRLTGRHQSRDSKNADGDASTTSKKASDVNTLGGVASKPMPDANHESGNKKMTDKLPGISSTPKFTYPPVNPKLLDIDDMDSETTTEDNVGPDPIGRVSSTGSPVLTSPTLHDAVETVSPDGNSYPDRRQAQAHPGWTGDLHDASPRRDPLGKGTSVNLYHRLYAHIRPLYDPGNNDCDGDPDSGVQLPTMSRLQEPKPKGWISKTFLTSIFLGIGGFLYGYDSGIITPSLALGTFVRYFDYPAPPLRGAIVSGRALTRKLVGAVILKAPSNPSTPTFIQPRYCIKSRRRRLEYNHKAP